MSQLLLLPSAERPGSLIPIRLQSRELLVHPIQGFGFPLDHRKRFQAHQQILVHREIREDLPALGNVTNAGDGAFVGGPVGDLVVSQDYLAHSGPDVSHNGLKERGLAHSITPHETCRLTRKQVNVDLLQDYALSVSRRQRLDR